MRPLAPYFIGFIATLVLLTACTTSSKKSESEYEKPLSIPKDLSAAVSEVDIPILYQIDRMEELINQKIKKTIYNDNSFRNNDNDKLKLKIEKDGRIQIDAKGNVISCSLPLRVEVEKKTIGKKKLLGKELFKRGNRVEFALIVFFDSQVAIDSAWKLVTQTTYRGLRWKDKPEATFLKIDISGLVEKELENKVGDLVSKIDETVHERLDVKSKIAKVWADLQKPILINKVGEKLWLQFLPSAVAAAPLNTKGENLYIQLKVQTHVQTLSGNSPNYEVDSTLPPLRLLAPHPDAFDLHILCKLSYSSINRILQEVLVEKELTIEGQTLKIVGAEARGEDNQLFFDIDVQGFLTGKITLQGTPKFNAGDNTMEIEQFDFGVSTEEWLVNIADQVLHEEIKGQIKQKLKIPLDAHVSRIPQLISDGIEKGKLKEKLNISVENMEVALTDIMITEQNFQFLVNGKGQMMLVLEKL